MHLGGLCVKGNDVIGVETRGEGGFGREHRSLTDDRRMVEDEALCGGHMGSQIGAHATLSL